ncbi:MAG: hypothetical protein ABIH11_05165 [Candidatus Altiarchaeota archaeon]
MHRWLDDGRGLQIVLLVFIIHTLALSYLFNFTAVDDAFISFRYADNLAKNRGFSYNEGRIVEGYSNFLWVLILSVFSLIGLDLNLASITLGLLLGILSIRLVYTSSRELFGWPVESRIIMCIIIAANPSIVFWFVSGMEIGLYAILSLSSFFLYLKGLKTGIFDQMLPLTLFLTALTRIDGIIIMAVTIFHYIIMGRKGFQEDDKRIPKAWVLTSLTLYAAYSLWRISYYGQLMPNTVHAKVTLEMDYFIRGALFLAAFILLNLTIISINAFEHRKEVMKSRGNTYIKMMVLSGAATYIAIGGDHMPGRLFVPYFSMYVILLAPALAKSVRHLRESVDNIILVAVLSLLLSWVYFGPWFFWKSDVEAGRRCVGSWIRENLDENSTIAVVEAGIIPYYSGRRTIDMCGLTEPDVAGQKPRFGVFDILPGHDRCDLEYGLAARPDYVSFFTANITEHDGGYVSKSIKCGEGEVSFFLRKDSYDETMPGG